VLNFTQALLTPTVISLLDGTSPGKTVVEFASGAEYTCAIIADGSTRCWGKNDNYQLGDGTDERRPEPVQPLDATGIFATTAAPLGATSRVTTSRAASTSMLVSWSAPANTGGFPITNFLVRYRKLGVVSWSEFAHPVSTATSITVTGLLPGTSYEFQVAAVTVLGTGPWQPSFVSVSVGSASSCAVTSDGRAECWGADSHGALGNGAGDASATPVPVVGIDGSDDANTAISIGSGDDYSCAVMKDESVACWGQNQDGQLGNGSTVDSARSVRVLGFNSDSPATSIGISASHACAVVDGGSENTRCWGKGDRGQLGDGGTNSQSTPIEVLDGNGYFDSVTGGQSFSCATEFGYVKCWGLNDVGQLGDGSTTNRPQGVSVPAFDYSSDDTGAANVTSAGSTVCALSYAETVWCWGYGLQGGLGNGANRNRSVPVRVSGIDGLTPATTAEHVESGGASTCAVMESGAVKCWGANAQGQLGNNSTVNSAIPVAVSGLDGSAPAKSATSVAVSEAGFACATLRTGGIVCWGDNSSGQLGDGTLTDRRTPVSVARAVGTTLAGGLPAAAPGAPQNLAVSVRLAETIGLDWDAPASNGGTRITSYEIRWARGVQQPDAANLLEIPGDQLSTRVAGLVPGVSYTFFVKAVNSVGTGPTARVTVVVPVEPLAPVVTKTAWSNRKITLTWLGVKTPAHSPIVDYVLTCEVADVFFRQTVGANARFASVKVDSDKRAACRVVARTDAGRGPGSDRVIVSLNGQG
jgi:alpha-tubulin suppressor-like RCC1 family protein